MMDFHSPKNYPLLEPDMKKWPIYRLASGKNEFAKTLEHKIYLAIVGEYEGELEELLNKCILQERNRVRIKPWKSDPPGEAQFWKRAQKELMESQKYSEGLRGDKQKELLRRIINRYVREIVGDFKISTFKAARKITHVLFGSIFNKFSKHFLPRLPFSRKAVNDRVKLYGYVEEVRKLYDEGCIIVVVPTHMSNLDSPLIGFLMEFRAGIPAFNYGAGLNLFDSELAAYFMHRLGAYRIDRRKKNKIYLEALQLYSKLALTQGVNSLFFTGGTRSRSGKIETNQKLGLLSTVVHAQREVLAHEEKKTIAIVPMTLSYHFTLEASKLIDHHLRVSGRGKYLRNKKVSRGVLDYMRLGWEVLRIESEAYACLGKPMDVFGNKIVENGESIDNKGNKVELSDYFTSDGVLKEDEQRESVYTTTLGEKITESFHRYTIILPSHLLAYVCFKYWFYREEDDGALFEFLKIPVSELSIPRNELLEILDKCIIHLKSLENDGIFILSEAGFNNAEDALQMGIEKLGVYHKEKPLILFNNRTEIGTENLNVLYYYHNRLDSYTLDRLSDIIVKI